MLKNIALFKREQTLARNFVSLIVNLNAIYNDELVGFYTQVKYKNVKYLVIIQRENK